MRENPEKIITKTIPAIILPFAFGAFVAFVVIVIINFITAVIGG